MSASRAPLLEVRRVTKRFPGVLALEEVSLALEAGEVVAVIGENGAGKSTLGKLIAGILRPDGGEIAIDGRRVEIPSPRAAAELGIGLVHQELELAENLTVAANIGLGREPARLGFLRHGELRRRAERALARVGAALSPDALVGALSVGERQLVEIARALALDARVLLLDEPTSSLAHGEAARLLAVVRELRARGVAVVYVSHRLGEVRALADRVVVLRDGRNAGELGPGAIEQEAMVRLMVGRDLAAPEAAGDLARGEPVLELRGLRTRAHPGHALDLEVRAGELVGVAGLVGAGRTELLETLFGLRPPLSGELRYRGAPLLLRGPSDAIRAGIGLVPEDRKLQGLFLALGVDRNVSVATLWRDSILGFLRASGERDLAERMVRDLRIKTPDALAPAGSLSGGNQQKVVLAKWLALGPRLLLLDEPTRGIDVGARGEIYALLRRLARAGLAVLFASSEMEELLELADRVLVLHEGRLAGELPRAELSEEAILGLATRAREVVPA